MKYVNIFASTENLGYEIDVGEKIEMPFNFTIE